MLDFIKKNSVIYLILVVLISCATKDNSGKTLSVSFSDNKVETVDTFQFYETEKGAVYLEVNNKDLVNKMKSVLIDSINFNYNDTTYNVVKDLQYFSRQDLNNKLSIIIDNKTKLAVTEHISNREMFYIGFKVHLEKFIKAGIIEPLDKI